MSSPTPSGSRLPDSPAPPRDMADLARLLEVFNNEFEKLARSHESLERRAAELQRELDRKRTMALLGEVAAAMAHEIRNPLGGIQIYAEILRRELAHDAERVQVLEKIIACVRQLERFVSEILTYSGQVQARRERQPLVPLLERCLELTGCDAERDYAFRGEVEVDAALMERTLVNLIRNAIEAGGGVRVETRSVPGAVLVRVADRGPGIGPEARARLFTPFFTTKAKGTGLGLAIAQKMVLAHGGEIRAMDREPPPGAVFEVRLPR